ncbi:MAG: lactate utilization protein B [Syntrophales bacterium]
MLISTEKFTELARDGVEKARRRPFLKMVPHFLYEKREAGLQSLPDAAAAHAYGAAIRSEALSRLPELLEEFERNATANGAKVFWARTAREASEYIVNLARKRGAQYVIKGKSMITEEIGLNELLSGQGIEPWEADLGEFIVQQLHGTPFHIIGPALNIPVEEIRDLFLAKAGMKEPTLDPVALGWAARLFLREKFHHAEFGVTGVNMAVAETGTIINLENEGNIRFAKASPRTQVSVMSLEKVVPTMADAMHLIRILSRNCSGQRISAYVSMDSGPRKEGEIDGPEELIIVIVDNGRSRIYQDPRARDALRCIRCAACLNICPVYRQIGGYAYGWVYSGPMGQVLMPLLLGLDKTQDVYRACTLCGACKSVCPVGIDHPELLLYYRSLDVSADHHFKGKRRPWKETLFFKAWGMAVKHGWLWNLALWLTRPFINRNVRKGVLREMNGAFGGWFRERDLPRLAAKTFHEKWEENEKARGKSSSGLSGDIGGANDRERTR